jgi:hypothetical protein
MDGASRPALSAGTSRPSTSPTSSRATPRRARPCAGLAWSRCQLDLASRRAIDRWPAAIDARSALRQHRGTAGEPIPLAWPGRRISRWIGPLPSPSSSCQAASRPSPSPYATLLEELDGAVSPLLGSRPFPGFTTSLRHSDLGPPSTRVPSVTCGSGPRPGVQHPEAAIPASPRRTGLMACTRAPCCRPGRTPDHRLALSCDISRAVAGDDSHSGGPITVRAIPRRPAGRSR